MLTLRLSPYAGDSRWSWDGGRYLTGQHNSEILPYSHPLLEQLCATDGVRSVVIVRERAVGRPPCDPAPRTVTSAEFDRALTAASHWPGDQVVVETEPRAPARVTAGARGTAPLYLAHDGRVLHGSWDMTALRPFATGLSSKEVARLLVYRPRYSHETVFTGIHRLTERSTAYFGGALYLRYPQPAPHGAPRTLAPGADVLAAFDQALDDALLARPIDPAATVFHLTGGFDSATVALRAASHWPHQLSTGALLIGGPGRSQQIRRRGRIRAAGAFGPHDHLVDAVRHLPLDPACARVGGIVSPYEEALHHPFRLLTAELAAQGARAVVTGLGGDEMVALSEEELSRHLFETGSMRRPWVGPLARAALEFADDAIAPPAPVNSMTLLSLETSAPPLLRAGIWPLHPFAHPDMVRLGEWLPLDWREFKQVQRRRLAAHGLGGEVVRPVERESFAEVVRLALTVHGVPLLEGMLAGGSPLFDGLVAPDALALALLDLRSGHYEEEYHAQLLEVIDLHLAAAAFL